MDPTRVRVASPLPLVALGVATAVAEAVLVREGMAALGGSELAWGVVLAVWLAAMSLGAVVGGHRTGARGADGVAVAVAFAGIAGTLVFRGRACLVGGAVGEGAGVWQGAWVWVAAVAPAALLGGWGFARLATAAGARRSAGAAYAWESVGAGVGGVAFTFVLADLGSVAALATAAAVGLFAFAVERRRAVAGFAAAAALVAAALPLEKLVARASWTWTGRLGSLVASRETRMQRLEVADGAGRELYADGRLVASTADRRGVAQRLHAALLLHDRPARVALVGGLADGSAQVARLHALQRLLVVEDDPATGETVRYFMPERAAGVELATGDPARCLARGGTWDLIALLDGDPVTLRRARTRTVEFFAACRRHLAPGGLLVVPVGVADTYLGGAGGALLATLAASLRAAFPVVVAVPGDEVVLVASDRPVEVVAAILEVRMRQRGIVDPDCPPALVAQLADGERVRALAGWLQASTAPLTTARHPRAVLLAASLHEGRGNPPLVRTAAFFAERGGTVLGAALLVAVVLLVASMANARGRGAALAALVGASSVTWWIVLLAIWQAERGAVYAEIGVFGALFMAGHAAGAAVAARRAASPGRWLAGAMAAGCAVSMAIAFLPARAGASAVVPVLVLVVGVLTGSAFPAVAALCGRGDGRSGVAPAFAADEAGAAAGALVVGVVVVPAVGVGATALGFAVLLLVGSGALGILATRDAV